MPLAPPAAPQRQSSAYSLHERTPSNDDDDTQPALNNDDDDIDDDIDDAKSVTSDRSDQSEEAAGLVSRLSDEQDRANRRAKYEGGSRLGAKTTSAYRTSNEYDDDDDAAERGRRQSSDEAQRSSMSAPPSFSRDRDPSASGVSSEVYEGVFRDRAGADKSKRRASRRRGFFARTWEISREALPTLSLSLVSLVLSGELLIHLAKWPVFSKVDKLFILIPILLNLKGNLEGNLSLRMSTSANIGELDIRRTRNALIFGNMALLQVQALIVSLFAGILSFVLGIGTGEAVPLPPVKDVPSNTTTSSIAAPTQMLIRHLITPSSAPQSRLVRRRVIHHHPAAPLDPSLRMRNTYFEFVMVIATAMLSASVSSAILGSFMCALVVVTRQMGGNPDNIASPLAGSLGDLLTLTLLGLLSSFLVRFEGTILATLILLGLVVACVVCFIAAYRNAYVRELLSSGWVPLVLAMFISSGAGVLLDSFVQRFEGFALLVPVMTGLPGACAAIFVSRTSTALHGGMGSGGGRKPTQGQRRSGRNPLPRSSGVMAWCAHTYRRYMPEWLQSIGGPTEGWLVPCTLFGLGMLVNMSFIGFVRLSGQMTFGAPFFVMFTITSAMGFVMSLSIAHLFSMLLWRYDYDPDIYCLPFVTSLVDVLGQSLLVMSYFIATWFGDKITAAVNNGHK